MEKILNFRELEDRELVQEFNKARTRNLRKSRQREKEKLVRSGYGGSIIRRLKKEIFNGPDKEWKKPDYIVYKEFQTFERVCGPNLYEDYSFETDYRKEQISKGLIKFVPSPYFSLSERGFKRLYYLEELTDNYAVDIYINGEVYDRIYFDSPLNLKPYKKYEEDLGDVFLGHTLKDAFIIANTPFSYFTRNELLDLPRKCEYEKKLKKYETLENSSKVLKKKEVETKRRKMEKNLLNRALKYDYDSDKFMDIVGVLPSKDEIVYKY